jgi:hypothetical protein
LESIVISQLFEHLNLPSSGDSSCFASQSVIFFA